MTTSNYFEAGNRILTEVRKGIVDVNKTSNAWSSLSGAVFCTAE